MLWSNFWVHISALPDDILGLVIIVLPVQILETMTPIYVSYQTCFQIISMYRGQYMIGTKSNLFFCTRKIIYTAVVCAKSCEMCLKFYIDKLLMDII